MYALRTQLIVRSFRQYKFAKACGEELPTHCCNCSMPLSDENTHTPEGWIKACKEGMCEDCSEDIIDFLSGDSS